jgi:hypothetical protein
VDGQEVTQLLVLAVLAGDDPCSISIDRELDARVLRDCGAGAACEAGLRSAFRSELTAAKDKPSHSWREKTVSATDWVVMRWFTAIEQAGEPRLDGLLAEVVKELSSVSLVDATSYQHGRCDGVPQHLQDALSAAVNAPLLALPLADRCALTQHLAKQVLDVVDWSRRPPLPDEKSGFIVLLRDDVPLLRPHESCTLTTRHLRLSGDVTFEFDPAQLVNRDYSCVDWKPERVGSLGSTLTFYRSFNSGVPTPNIPGLKMRAGRPHFGGLEPVLEIQVDVKASSFKTRSTFLRFGVSQETPR